MSGPENILAVDTSSQVLAVAIRKGAQSTYACDLSRTAKHAENLISLIEEGLATLKLRKTELTKFVWGLGPGSFTGLRIGLSALKGLALGLGGRTYGVSSLDVVALDQSILQGELAVCVDARRDHIYMALYRFSGGEVKRVLPGRLATFRELADRTSCATVFTGDALNRYGSLLKGGLGADTRFMDSTRWFPSARGLLRLHDLKPDWLEQIKLVDMVPRYLRSPEAEEKRPAGKKKRIRS